MIVIDDLIENFSLVFPALKNTQPWDITDDLKNILEKIILTLGEDFTVQDSIAIHKTAVIEPGTVIKKPAIIGMNCHIGANAYFREGVYLGNSVKIGPSCEIKACIICSDTAIAHFNYIGNSIIGNNVNFEAGSIAANHYNERISKEISVQYRSELYRTTVTKFGSLVGDHSKIGANAVLSPGTILEKNTIVKRLELIEQIKGE